MKKLLLIPLLITSLFAGWMNVDSLNVKQKFRFKNKGFDQILYIQAADSLADTTIIHSVNDSIGIGTNNPEALLHINGNIKLPDGDSIGIVSDPNLLILGNDILNVSGDLYLDNDEPISFDVSTGTATSLYMTQGNGAGQNGAWKLTTSAGASAIPNYKFEVATDSQATGGNPSGLTYTQALQIAGATQNMIIGNGAPSADYKLQVSGSELIDNNLVITDTLTVNDDIYATDNIYLNQLLEIGTGTGNILLDAIVGSALTGTDDSRMATANTYTSSFGTINDNSLLIQGPQSADNLSINFFGGTTGRHTVQIYDTTLFAVFTDSVYMSGNVGIGGNIDIPGLTFDSLGINTSTLSANFDVNGTSEFNDTSYFNGNLVIADNTISYGGNATTGIGFNSSNVLITNSNPTVTGDSRAGISVRDTTTMAAGVGGGINFHGKYTTAGAYTDLAGLKAYKSNATDGNYSGELHFQTRNNGSTEVTRVVIDNEGDVGIGTTVPDRKLVIAEGPDTIKIDALQWGVFSIGAGSFRTGGLTAPGNTEVAGINIYLYGFGGQLLEPVQNLYGSAKVPPDALSNDTVWITLRWAPSTTGTGDVRWYFTYAIVHDAATTVSSLDGSFDILVSASGTADRFENEDVGFITGLVPTDEIMFRIYRDPNATGDDYTADALLLSLHFTYRIARLGYE